MAHIHNDYMKCLHEWQKICNFHHAMYWQYHNAGIGTYLLPSSNVATPQQQTATATGTPLQRAGSTPEQAQVPGRRREFTQAPISYRLYAELIDFFILMTLKMFFILFYSKLTGESGGLYVTDQYQFMFSETMEDELTVDDLRHMMVMGFVYRLLACLYEATFLALGGATPGKLLVGLEVVSCRVCVSSQRGNQKVLLVYPGNTPSLGNSWIRSLIKNVSITFLMPAFLTIFFYQHNRASYDIVSNTIVVKSDAD